MKLPPGAIDPTETRIFLAVLLANERGRSPSLVDLGRVVGLRSKSSVHFRVASLVAEGLIEHTPRSQRDLSSRYRRVPFGR